MNRALIILFLLLLSHIAISAKQDKKLDFGTVDILTYRLYMEQKWDSVIITGKLALNQGIDYYYLRLRIGISYFNQAAYYPAITHLKKAKQFNSSDPVVANYLYYALKYTGQQEEASLLRAKMTPDAQKMLDQEPGLIELVHAESGFTFSSSANPGNLSTLMEQDSVYGEQDLYGNNTYLDLGLKLRLSKTIGLHLAYNYLNFNKTKYIQYGQAERNLLEVRDTLWDGIYPGQLYLYETPDPWHVYDTSFQYQVKQHEFHAGFTLAPGNGFRIMPAFHYLRVGYTMTNVSYRFDTIDSPWYYSSYDDSLYTTTFRQLVYSFEQKDTTFNNYLVSLKLSKNFSRFNLGVSGSWSNLNGLTQKQLELSLTYFPFGNVNYYGTTTVTGFLQKSDKRLLLSQVLGAKITPWMWAEGNFYYGDYTNANIFNGAIVYNNSDVINYRTGGSLIFLVGRHIQLSLIYQYAQKESQQIYYTKEQDPTNQEINEVQQSKNNSYFTNSLFGGITWKP